MKKKNIVTAIAIATTLGLSTAVLAAESHDLTVSADIEPILNFTMPSHEVNFGTFDATNIHEDVSTPINGICVYSNSSSNYTVTLSSDYAESGNLYLKHGTDKLNYKAEWFTADTASDVGTGDELKAGTASSAYAANHSSLDCGGMGNASMLFSLKSVDMQAVPYGGYEDILKVEVNEVV